MAGGVKRSKTAKDSGVGCKSGGQRGCMDEDDMLSEQRAESPRDEGGGGIIGNWQTAARTWLVGIKR